MWKKKIKAFTFSELIVVMLLSSVVLTMAYSAFNIVNKSFLHFNQQGEVTQNIIEFNTRLSSDFENASIITANSNSVKFESKRSEIFYEFTSFYIVRNQSGTRDTFNCQSKNIEFSFLDNSSSPFKSKVIDELQFRGTFGIFEFFFHFKKQYAANILLQHLNK